MRGNVILGERLAASSRAANSSLTSANAGATGEVTRRTPRTSLRVDIPVGVSIRNSTFGDFQAQYSTPRTTWSYQGQNLSGVGQLPLGVAQRSLAYSVPSRGGDFTLFSGVGLADGLRGFHVYGARARALLPRGLASIGLFDARASDGGGSMRGAVLGIASVPGKLDVTAEGVLEATRGLNFTPDANSFSYQVRADYGSPSTYVTATARRLADGFSALQGQGARNDRFSDVTFRTQSGKTHFAGETGIESFGSGADNVQTRRGTFTIDRDLGRNGEFTLFFTNQGQTQATLGSTQSRSIAGNLNFAFRNGSLQANVQTQRTTSDQFSPATLLSGGISGTRQIGALAAVAGYQTATQHGNGAFNATHTFNVGLERDAAHMNVALNATLTRAVSAVSDATIFEPLLNLTRHLSPVTDVTLQAGFQMTRDRLNPAASGHNGIINLSIGTPFSIGSSRLAGRIDPRLPATILGTVYNDAVAAGAFNAGISTGVGGVVVVLDGVQSQITDAQGNFAFRFVVPGRHEVRLEPGSLPRGYVADSPFVAVNVLGGQVAQLSLGVGAYGAVEGHVLRKDRLGRTYPIPDANVKIDHRRNTVSGPGGAFGFGRLTPGKHTIELTTASLPATVALVGEDVRTIEVQTGRLADVEFEAQPLGSIAGKIVTGGENGAPNEGVPNAYVVASPGDHAAITDPDGSFLIDNLAPGTYTVAVELDSLPEESGVGAGPRAPFKLEPNQEIVGLVFTIVHQDKAIDFTFSQKESSAAIVHLDVAALPPGGATGVSVTASKAAQHATAHVFGKDIALVPDRARKTWRGHIVVPINALPGNNVVVVSLAGAQSAQASVVLDVNPALPIALFSLQPARPVRGQYVHVRARFATDAVEGDRITWQDGSTTKLPRPISARVFDFTTKVSAMPFHGILHVGHLNLPITLK